MSAKERIKTALIVVSDRAARGERADKTEALMREAMHTSAFELVRVDTVPDERAQLARHMRECADECSLVLTTGGTGLAKRDVTPEATRDVIEAEVPGLAEEMRRRSVEKTVHAMGSRALAGVRGRALIVNLPGRPAGAVECFQWIEAALPHLVAVLRGPVDDASHETHTN